MSNNPPSTPALTPEQIQQIREHLHDYTPNAGDALWNARQNVITLCDSHESLRSALTAAQAERDVAREALCTWGSHDEGCPAVKSAVLDCDSCECGFTSALRGLPFLRGPAETAKEAV